MPAPQSDSDSAALQKQKSGHGENHTNASSHQTREQLYGKSSNLTCEDIGLYSWNQSAWQNSENSNLINYLLSDHSKRSTCGDIYVNVADYSNPDFINQVDQLVPFMQKARKVGNTGVIWLTYGDVTKRNETACMIFLDTFFKWVDSLSGIDAQTIAPIGVSFDVEHFSTEFYTELLQKAQRKKSTMHYFSPDDLLIQCMIEGEYKPNDTDVIMRYADRALMMVYRNYLTSPEDPDGMGNGLMKQMHFMFKEQCDKCLDDTYAKQHYKANITIMFETACKLGSSCKDSSFCARDGGMLNLMNTISRLDNALTASGLMSKEQKERLLAKTSPYALHHWEWAQCFYEDPLNTNYLCNNFKALAKDCRVH